MSKETFEEFVEYIKTLRDELPNVRNIYTDGVEGIEKLQKQNEILMESVEYYSEWKSPLNKSDMRCIGREALRKIKDMDNESR